VPAEIPEIDGPVLAQLVAVLGAGWLIVAARREEEGGDAADRGPVVRAVRRRR
jgi:hypothetical protein